MQVIEKVKVVPEGYNGAGMDGMYGHRDVNGKANAGLTLGIIGTALGAWALFGNRRSAGNISVKNTICKKPTKFVINSKIN